MCLFVCVCPFVCLLHSAGQPTHASPSCVLSPAPLPILSLSPSPCQLPFPSLPCISLFLYLLISLAPAHVPLSPLLLSPVQELGVVPTSPAVPSSPAPQEVPELTDTPADATGKSPADAPAPKHATLVEHALSLVSILAILQLVSARVPLCIH